jgi:hypothetical protein
MVSALLGVRGMRMVWVGWAEIEDATPTEKESIRQTLWQRGCVPVFITLEEARLYYNGFCNDVLWPLFHYVVARMPDTRGDLKSGFHAQWEAYQAVNKHFADAVLKVVRCEHKYGRPQDIKSNARARARARTHTARLKVGPKQRVGLGGRRTSLATDTWRTL